MGLAVTKQVAAGQISSSSPCPLQDSWGRLVEPLFSQFLMQVIEGNHELENYELQATQDAGLAADR